jgi:4-alpha-glucanotransferase
MAAGTTTGTSLDRDLSELAGLYGVQTSYLDMGNRRIEAHPESVILALQALGAPVRGMDDAARAIQLTQADRQRRGAEPVIVAWDGRLSTEATRLPARMKGTLVLEDGKVGPWPPKKILPHGYHTLNIKTGSGIVKSLVISAPVQANFPLSEKVWGIFAPLYSLHSRRSFGAGDLTDLGSLMDWMHAHGGRVISTLPLLAGSMEEPCEPSPYSPLSRLFWNEFYIDPARAPEFASSPRAQRLMEARPPESKLVNYSETMKAKRRVLEELADSFFKNLRGPRYKDFQRFLRENPELAEYVRFRARTDRTRRKSAEGYYLYAQFLVQAQLRELADYSQASGSLLYLDLPLGLHHSSFDAWRYPELFVKGMDGGAPPDPVFTTGQNWAFKPIHPEAMRADGYRYAIAYIRNHLRFAKLLRIDHVMGLHRLFWIPEGLTGERGLYVRYPAHEMYAILSLESHRAGAGFVGENLGVVPPEVNESMARHNVRPLYVAQYETAVGSGEEALRQPSPGSVASLNTHDLFPFQGFLEGTDIDERLRLRFINSEEAAAERNDRERTREALSRHLGQDVFEGCLKFLARSKADIVLLNPEDLWHETKPQNIPSTTREHPNWKRRMRHSLERLKRLAPPPELTDSRQGIDGPEKPRATASPTRRRS